MSGIRIAVVGATGVVGSTMLRTLAERKFPASEVVPLASARSAGREVSYGDQTLTVQALDAADLSAFDLAIFSAGSTVSHEWGPKFAEAGALVIDNSSFWRMDERVPLVVPEINGERIADALGENGRGIVANPNCSTAQMVMALKPILDKVGIERIVVSTYQSVSGTGQAALEEMRNQSKAILGGEEPGAAEIYPHQIAFNVIPQVEKFKDGDPYTTEERKMVAETRKILGNADLKISATCARVPVEIGHCESVNVQTRDPLSPEECRELLASTDGVAVMDDPSHGIYPLPIVAAGKDDVLVGRIRVDESAENCLNLWIVSDNLRKGAALNAVQVAEAAIARGYIGS